MSKRKSVQERFLAFLPTDRNEDECWLWMGARDKDGYGWISINGKNVHAHRLSYELSYGPITVGLLIRHECDNPPCVNPRHLLEGTHFDNVQDSVRRGRHKSYFTMHRGKDHPRMSAKLTEDQVRLIRNEINVGCREFGRIFSVSHQTISDIRNGKKWKWFDSF